MRADGSVRSHLVPQHCLDVVGGTGAEGTLVVRECGEGTRRWTYDDDTSRLSTDDGVTCVVASGDKDGSDLSVARCDAGRDPLSLQWDLR